MILLSPYSVIWLLGGGVAGGFLVLCLSWRMWFHAWVVALICAGCLSHFIQDTTRDRSVDGGVFVRDAGAIVWQKADNHD